MPSIYSRARSTRTFHTVTRCSKVLSCVLALTSLAACSEKATPTPTQSIEQARFRITAPAAGVTLHGAAEVTWEMSSDLHATQLSTSLDDAEPAAFRSFAPISLDTLALTDGHHQLTVSVLTESGETLSDTVDFDVENPEQRLESFTANQDLYASGQDVVLDLVYSGPGVTVTADFADVDGSTAPVIASTTEPGHYRATHRLAKVTQAFKRVKLHAKNAAGETVDDSIPLQLRALPTLPIEVAKAYFVDDDEPPYEVVAPSEAIVPTLSGSPALVTGVPSTLSLTWSDPNGVEPDRLIMKVEGFSGYYVLPIEPGQTQADVEVSLPSFKPGDDMDTLRFVVGLVGLMPKIAFASMDLRPYSVPNAGVQFTLRWDKPADLDLIVETPEGKIIDYQNVQQGNGKLDLDADSVCIASRDNIENVDWPGGTELAGTYQVFANLSDACGQEDISYEVVATYCGKTVRQTGVFHASDATGSSQGRLILPPIVNDCTKTVHGSVKFEKPRSNPVALVSAPVRAVATDGKLLAQGHTKKDGTYTLKFANAAAVNYRVEVDATWVAPLDESPRVSVAELTTEDIYRYRTKDEINGSQALVQKDVLITKADYSGAFNIVNTARKVFEWVRDTRGVLLDPVGVRWSQGVATPGNTSYFKSGQLFIQGAKGDPDEFDDSIVAHEFMHYVADAFDADDTLGGNHNGNMTWPRLAWSEGLATALGQVVLKSPEYIDTTSVGIRLFRNIESGTRQNGDALASAQGTSSGKMDGDISEDLVAMVLWDLVDSANEPHDRFNQTTKPMYGSILEVLRTITLENNRGVLYTDFVDFLDGFRCKVDAKNPAKLDADLRLLLEERKFPYDYATTGIGCGP